MYNDVPMFENDYYFDVLIFFSILPLLPHIVVVSYAAALVVVI